ncbi:uncharacterized protein LOC126481946 [Schistocerca serialis cubense]|uniref:uncharacterized protein LOC126481946 n=1 Tax=Schistocerca serialis cubense TaxID=2023355 RepID=UPI00214EA680|nr:uncharacterized protein LOC126481946 [Schistocerca serialis cubense]
MSREDIIDSPQVLNPSNVSNSFFLRCVTVLEILKTISNLKVNTSSDWNDISGKFLRECSNELIKPQKHLINSTFSHGLFPDFLKVTKIRLVHKKGITTDVKNYRPISLTSILSISLTSILSKLLERLLPDQLESFFCKCNLLKSSQDSFRKDRSTITAVPTFFQAVLRKLDDGNKTVSMTVKVIMDK